MFKVLKNLFSKLKSSKKIKEIKVDPLESLIPDNYPLIDLTDKCIVSATFSEDELEIIKATEEDGEISKKELEIPKEMSEADEDFEIAQLLNSELEKVNKSKNKIKNYG